ncbi:MAG: SRPBCC domain-containing protein [Pseudomonadota bacterium]
MRYWILGALAVLAVLFIAGLMIKKSVRAEVVIRATPEEVWAVITDPSAYGSWNPIFVSYDGTFDEGNTLTLALKMGDTPTPVQVTVRDLVANEWLHQGGGYPVILTYDHNWYLEAVPDGTRVTQYEYYTGLYVLFWDPAPAQRLYEAGNRSLKARLEGDAS